MTTARDMLCSPLGVLIAAMIAFGGWIVYDAYQTPDSSETADLSPHRELAVWPPRLPPDQLLMSLHVGMPRIIAQRQLAQLPPAPVTNAAISASTPIADAAYLVTLHRPIPHLMPVDLLHPFQPGDYCLTVEYANDRPGAPIARITLTPTRHSEGSHD
ncbi:MAG: hypothetical protein RMJ56_03215 [Gemmataceae bacterium]|nr:hypothetical protein [Gemmata sp.]MDW8196598.1 hypothetical protein [Gemmataceae bacterium]